jgi:hypothetical protein
LPYKKNVTTILIKPFGAYYERVIYDEKGKSVILKANDKLPESALQDV